MLDSSRMRHPRRQTPVRVRGHLCMVAMGVIIALPLKSGSVPQPRTHTVVIENMRFTPESLVVRRGERIVWINKDLFPHTATESRGVFDSGSIAAGGSWTYTAAGSGEYAYGCTLHPTMKARITVR